MSIEAMKWAMEFAPPMPSQLVATLTGLAYHADKHGRGAYPSVARLAALTCKSDRSVRRDLRELEDLKLIRRGDQSKAAHMPTDKRPVVYDLAVERTVPKGRAGDDEGTRTSARTLASSRERGRATREAKKSTSVPESPSERGDVDVRPDVDVPPDVDVQSGVTWTSAAGGRGRPPNPKDEPVVEPSSARTTVPSPQPAGEIPDQMADEFMKRFARGNTYRRNTVRRVIVDALARETDPQELWAALVWLGKTSRNVTDGALQFAFSKVRNTKDETVVPMRRGGARAETPSHEDFNQGRVQVNL